jgi:hypothetical protein
MPLDRRRLVAGYVLTVLGLLLAIVIADLIPNVPAPPACSTNYCYAADLSALVGLFLIVAGIVMLGVVIARSGPDGPPGPPGWGGSSYSFVAPPAGGAPAAPGGGPVPREPTPPGPPAAGPAGVTRCPACGSPVTSEYGFCPKCGHTLGP